MTDRELDQLFAAAREEQPEIAPVRADVLRRLRVRRGAPWFGAFAVAATAAAFAIVFLHPAPVDWNVPLAATPAILAEPAPLRLAATPKPAAQRSAPFAVAKRAPKPMEIKLVTDDPDVVIIWLTEGDE